MRYFLFPIILASFVYVCVCPASAVTSVQSGLLLWYHSVLPTLFPFMFLSSFFIHSKLINTIPFFLSRPLRSILGCSHAGASAVMIGFLCGFPMGAKITYDLYQTDQLSLSEREFLYEFTNNLSPGFLISYLTIRKLNSPQLRLPVLFCTLGASLFYGWLRSCSFRKKTSVSSQMDPNHELSFTPGNLFTCFDTSITSSVQNILKLCGYIVLFSILSDAAISLLAPLHSNIFLAASVLEVSKGIDLICRQDLSDSVKLCLCTGLASFGGLSAAFQTAGITEMDQHTFLNYIKSRAIITLLSITFTILYLIMKFHL